MKRLLLLFLAVLNLSFQSKDNLNSVLNNCLISDTESNIARINPIIVTEIDEANNRIKTNYKALTNLLIKATDNQVWFITQSEEASNMVEIISVDEDSGWITLGETYAGFFNMDEGETLEFFNPFINYKIINNKPLFKDYPTHIEEEYINYIQSGGILKEQKTIMYY